MGLCYPALGRRRSCSKNLTAEGSGASFSAPAQRIVHSAGLHISSGLVPPRNDAAALRGIRRRKYARRCAARPGDYPRHRWAANSGEFPGGAIAGSPVIRDEAICRAPGFPGAGCAYAAGSPKPSFD